MNAPLARSSSESVSHARRQHAFVESPFQFLSALEAVAPHASAVLHWRADAKGMRAFVDAFDPAWLPAGVSLSAGIPEALHGAAPDCEPEEILVGDLASGRIQRMLSDAYLTRYLPPVTVIDDGLSTPAVIRQLMTTQTPIHRPRHLPTPLRLPLAAYVSSRLRGLARKGRLTWFTALLDDPGLQGRVEASGIRVRTHRFEHLHTLDACERPDTPGVVIGSAMAADGLIDPEAYTAWVRGVARSQPVTYYPHRREPADFLDTLARLPGVRVAPLGLPLELRLSTLPDGVRVHSLPSTAAFSLSLLNPGSRVAVTAIPTAWWRPRASAAFRREIDAFAAGFRRFSHAEGTP